MKYKPGERYNKFLKKKSAPMKHKYTTADVIGMAKPAPTPMASAQPSPFVSPIKPGEMFNATNQMASPLGAQMQGMKPGSLFNTIKQAGQGQIGQGQTAGLIDDATKYISDTWDSLTKAISDVYKSMRDAAAPIMEEYGKKINELLGQMPTGFYNNAKTQEQFNNAQANEKFANQAWNKQVDALMKERDQKVREATNAAWNANAPGLGTPQSNSSGISNVSFNDIGLTHDPVPPFNPTPNMPGYYTGGDGTIYQAYQTLAPLPGVTGTVVLTESGDKNGSRTGGTLSPGGTLSAPSSGTTPSQTNPFGTPPGGQAPAAIMSQPQMLKRKSVKMKKKLFGFKGTKKVATSTPSGPKQFRNNLRATKKMIDEL